MTTYHHGNLAAELLERAAEMAQEVDLSAITLRELARRTGVSHSAPVHHFGTRQGLLTALAFEGFELLGEALERHAGDIYEMGVAYVMWGLNNPGHYAVMWQPRLLDETDPRLVIARERAWQLLADAVAARLTGAAGAADAPGAPTDAYAAFALVHGLVSIWLNGALPTPKDPHEIAAEVVRRLRFDERNGS